MQCVILAGGLATRMRPITETIPKVLIPVLDQPFAHHQLSWLAKQGVTEVIFSIGYKAQQVMDYVKDGSAWGLKVKFVDAGENLRGTAGALRLALDQNLLPERFFVLYGDSYLPIPFQPIWNFFAQRPESALMTVFKNAEKYDQSNVCKEGDRVTLYDKWIKEKPATMQFIDYGLSLFKRTTIESQIPANQKLDLATIFHDLSKKNDLAAYEVKTRFYEIGSPAGLEDLRKYLQNPNES